MTVSTKHLFAMVALTSVAFAYHEIWFDWKCPLGDSQYSCVVECDGNAKDVTVDDKLYCIEDRAGFQTLESCSTVEMLCPDACVKAGGNVYSYLSTPDCEYWAGTHFDSHGGAKLNF